jgi:hypothetical protein
MGLMEEEASEHLVFHGHYHYYVPDLAGYLCHVCGVGQWSDSFRRSFCCCEI